MGFSRQEYWSGLPCPPPRDLPDPGIKPGVSCIAGRFFTVWATREAHALLTCVYFPHPGELWVNYKPCAVGGGQGTWGLPTLSLPSSFIHTLLDFPAQTRTRCGEFLLENVIVHTCGGLWCETLSPVCDFPPLFPLSPVYVFLLLFLLLCFSLILCLPCFQEALSGSSPDNFLKSLCFPPLSYLLTSIFPVSNLSISNFFWVPRFWARPAQDARKAS